MAEYQSSSTIVTTSPTGSTVATSSKREDDPEFQAMLAQRSTKRHRNDYDRFIEIPNHPSIPSALDWWRTNQGSYTDLGKNG
jgi:hypothetical protein